MIIPTLANMGTALMWAGIFHLWIGNLLIGFFEAALLIRFFGAPRLRTIGLIVAANYASAWLGMVLIGATTHLPVDVTIQNVGLVFIGLMALAFVLTLVIEFPFFRAAIPKEPGRTKRAIRATLIVHGISYLLLCGYYGGYSSTGLMTGLKVVEAADMPLPSGYTIYRYSPDESRVVASDLTGANERTVAEIDASLRWTYLGARPAGEDRYRLIAAWRDRDSSLKTREILGESSGITPSVEFYSRPETDADYLQYRSHDDMAKFPLDSDWQIKIWGDWYGVISGENRKTNDRLWCGLETPFFAWHIFNATQVDGDFLVFELSNNQVCVLDPNTRRIALIARGTDPVVVRRADE